MLFRRWIYQKIKCFDTLLQVADKLFFDVFLLESLSAGLEQKDLPDELKAKKISPSSMSSIEKRLKLLKENFNANNPTQLVAIAKDFGLI